MVILYKDGQKVAFETEINEQQKERLLAIRDNLTVFNENNYYEVGESRTFNPDPSLYSEFGDYFYIPYDYKKYGYNGIEIRRKSYCSYYKDTLKLIASILKGKPKIVDLTTKISNNFESIEALKQSCDILLSKIEELKGYYSKEDIDYLKRNFTSYSSIIECLENTKLVKSKTRIKEQ